MATFHRLSSHDTIERLLATRPHAARALIDRGMHCVGCAIAPFETIAEACAIYGVVPADLLAALDHSEVRPTSVDSGSLQRDSSGGAYG